MSALRDPKQLQLAIAGACQCPPSSLPSISLLLRLTLSSTALEKKPYSLETSRLITLHRTRLSEIDRARILKQKRSAASKAAASATASGGVKKKSKNADYTKKRRQPPSEEVLTKRRAAAQKAAMTRKECPDPVKRRQVRVYMRFDSTLIPKGQAKTKMMSPSSGRLVDVGSAAHIAAQSRSSLGCHWYRM